MFGSHSALSLTEDQFKSLSNAERQAKSDEMIPQIASLKQLVAAVAQAGRAAAANGDAALARKYFSSLHQCGTALNSPDCLRVVQLVGKALIKMADTELSQLGK